VITHREHPSNRTFGIGLHVASKPRALEAALVVKRLQILIVGLGEVGSHLAHKLHGEHHAVTVVDSDRQRLLQVTRQLDVQSVVGDGSRPDVLDRADAYRTDLLLAVSNDDNVNMLACLFGRRIGAKRAILRMRDASTFRQNTRFFEQNLMVDKLLSLDELAAEEIVKLIRRGSAAIGIESFLGGKVQMRGIRLTETSDFVHKKLREIQLPPSIRVAAIDRRREILIPNGETRLEVGDDMLAIGEPKRVLALEKKAGVKESALRRVLIFGGSGVVPHVARPLLRQNVKVRVIVPDKQRAEELVTELDGPVVIQGEGTDLKLLEEERIGDMDAFLALSRRDEVNLMASQLVSRKYGVRTAALVQSPVYKEFCDQTGVTDAVSPRALCTDKILAYIRGKGVNTIETIEEGQAEIIEVRMPRNAALVGKTVAEANLPVGCVIGAIQQETGRIVIPDGTTRLQADDTLVVFLKQEAKDVMLQRLGLGSER
jgi:trk system potassium uptake protein TrkA